MSDKVWVNITKWLKPVGSTFTTEGSLVDDQWAGGSPSLRASGGTTVFYPAADPASYFGGNWVIYQNQSVHTDSDDYLFATYKRMS